MKQNNSIFTNQVGFLPEDNKYFYISGIEEADSQEFELCDANSGKTVYSGKITTSLLNGRIDELVGEEVFSGDFSSLKEPGTYFIRMGKKESFRFSVSDNVYDDLFFSTLNYFKLSRCGQGKCHTGTAEVYGTKEEVNVQGGWHDAGDYGRYIVAGTKTVMDLLLAYDEIGTEYKRFDILNEVRFELEWMLQMQRKDGGVYHKISCYHFCGFINPEEEKDQLVLAPVSISATADFAGCLAYSAKYFENIDAGFAKKLLEAAEKAQEYLDTHEDDFYINPPEITTGGYGDKNLTDERYFAACSLWAATGEEKYLKTAEEIREKEKKRVPDPQKPWDKGWEEFYSWAMVSGYGSEILLQNESALEKIEGGKELLEDIKAYYLKSADNIVDTVNNSSFKTGSRFFMWGSNGYVCDLGHVLMVAYRITKNEKYRLCAKAQIDYILGCNPLNYCYVTGMGTKNPVNPHHRPSGASKSVMPGMLAGGPCSGLHDEYAKTHLTGSAPLKCYVDAVPSYSTNEVAIYWNSAFVYLLAALK